ncbi:response regulator receiver protein [Rhodococcus ruber BKS 20-38]|uniref:Response regulator receiver protein n=1 Tax=Rhodococcus ruber BKS 20-38 TaxID=1278076 RepID=M2ZXM1_9NOCA|nr:response regulator receiver protein [Rhodococcus ruber BKS 20-38]
MQIGLSGNSYELRYGHEPAQVLEMISTGESATVEFKSSVRVPLDQQVEENVIVESFIKAIAGFLNARGGTLLVGVQDSGSIIGLDYDLEKCGGSEDKLLRFVVDKINSYLGNVAGSVINTRYVIIRNKRILKIDVPRSGDLVFPVRSISGNSHQLYVRQGRTRRCL